MRLIFGLVLIVGVGLAGFAVYMARDFIGSQKAQLAAERAARAQVVPTVEVFVINEQLRYGQTLSEENIRIVRWPENAIPEGAFQTLADLFPEGERRFRTVLRTMEKDEAILAVKVTNPGADAGVSSQLEKGMRAFAIRVDVASGVSGFLRPGDKVDIYWTGRVANGEGRAQEMTTLIEAAIHIIAIDQTADADRSSPTIARTVTVSIKPNQVAALAQAQTTGKLSLSLVGAEDDSIAEAIEVDQNQLLGITIAEAAQAIEQKVCTIKTRRGADIVETPVTCPGQ